MRELCVVMFLGINTWVDVKKREISVVTVTIFGLIGVLAGIGTSAFSWQYLLSEGVGAFFLGMSVLTHGAVGMGDSLLLLVLGILLSPEEFFIVLFLGLLCCGLWAVVLLAVFRKGKDAEIPFVPFLLLGYVGSFFW